MNGLSEVTVTFRWSRDKGFTGVHLWSRSQTQGHPEKVVMWMGLDDVWEKYFILLC